MVEDGGLIEKFIDAQNVHGTDVAAYAKAVSQEFSTELDAFAHYQAAGCFASPELFPLIDPDYYCQRVPIALPDAVTPFEHYVTEGARQGVSPTPLFDPMYIQQQAKHLIFENIFDFLGHPGFSAIDPHPLFSKKYYNSLYDDVANSGMDPFLHFMRHGWQERRVIHPFFGPREYQRFGFTTQCDRGEFNRLLLNALESPALSLMQPLFDPSYYVQSLGSEKDSDTPLQHFLTSGWRQHASAFPLFDEAFFLSQEPGIRDASNPYVEYLSDFSHSFSPSQYFDAAFYRQSTFVDPGFKGSLLEHFVQFGAADSARPHRMLVVTNTYPSSHSGLVVAKSFIDLSGNQFWLCRADIDRSLASSLDEIHDVELSLSGDFLEHCSLHPHSGPLNKYARSLIAVVRKIARCNCLVVSGPVIDEECISRLFSPTVYLVSRARPWLTLLSCSGLTIKYWHLNYGCKAAMDWALPDDWGWKASFVATALLASIPNKLVVKTDAFGIALLRTCGSQILAAVPQVSLLVDFIGLEPEDRQWLLEYIAINYTEFSSLIGSGECVEDSSTFQKPTMEASTPRIISL